MPNIEDNGIDGFYFSGGIGIDRNVQRPGMEVVGWLRGINDPTPTLPDGEGDGVLEMMGIGVGWTGICLGLLGPAGRGAYIPEGIKEPL